MRTIEKPLPFTSKIITLCGSTKFKNEFMQVQKRLALEGNLVFSVAFFGHQDGVTLTQEEKMRVDAVHLRKISISDEIMVIDQYHYIGETTREEIEFAFILGKKVNYMSADYPELLKDENEATAQ